MTDDEILSHLGKIEIREGKERKIKSYVLRNNVLTDKEKETVLRYMPRYGFFFEDKPLDLSSLFPTERPVVVEIGFGMGDSLHEIALRRPDCNYIGIEVFLQGFVKLLKRIGDDDMDNVRITRFDAVEVLEHMIPDGSIEGFHIFFPDPWPKKRHHKRRLMQLPFIHLLATKLRQGGYIYMVTDWEEYAEEVVETAKGEPLLYNSFEGFAPPVAWRPITKFERKGMEKEYTINEIWLEKL